MNKHIPQLLISLSLTLALSVSFAHLAFAQGNSKNSPQAQEIYVAPTRWQRNKNYQQPTSPTAQPAQASKPDSQPSTQVTQAAELNRKAVLLGKQGHWEQAIATHEEACKLDPANKQYRINLSAARVAYGKQRLSAGDYMGAAGLFRKALSIAPDNGLAGNLLADTIKRMGKDPNSADVRLAIGDWLASTGDYAGAAVEYETALQIESSSRTYIKMGEVAQVFGQLRTAANWYQQAMVKDPKDGAAYRQLGLLLASQKDYKDAVAELRRAVILDPKDSLAAQALVSIWREQVAANPAIAENHLGLAGAYQMAGDYPDAQSEYNKTAALNPRTAGLQEADESLMRAYQHSVNEKHYLAAEALFGQGLKKEALPEITQAVMAEPKNAKYQYLLGQCLEANGNYQGAHQAYLTSALIDPENNKEAAQKVHDVEEESQSVNQANSAAATPRPSISTNSDTRSKQQSTINLAKSTTTAQPEPTTNSSNTQVVNESPQEASAVSAAEEKKDYSSAVALLKQICAKNPQNPDIHHQLAVNLLSDGQISDAISEFRIASDLAPGKKIFAEDLDRAMNIYKRCIANDSSVTNNVGGLK